MDERFEATTLRLYQVSFLVSAVILFTMAVVVPMFIEVPDYYTPLMVGLAGMDLVWMHILAGARYELSSSGLRVTKGPIKTIHPWDSLVRARPTKDRRTWARGFALDRPQDEELFVHPADPLGFLATVRRYAPHIEITPEADEFARGNHGVS